MAIQTGARLTPARINTRTWDVNYQGPGAFPIPASQTVIPGTVLTFQTFNPNSAWSVSWTGDFQLTTAAPSSPYGTGTVQLSVDNVLFTPRIAIWNPANVAPNARETEGQSASGTFATPGTHTFRLIAQWLGTGAGALQAGHTGYTAVVYP